MNTKKILFPFIGDSIGGSHIATLNLIKNIDRTELKNKIVIHKKGKLSNYLDYQKKEYELIDIKYFSYKIFILNIVLNVFSNLLKKIIYLKKNNITIIHCNDVRSNLIWILPSFILRIKHIWHHHSVPNKRNFFWIFIYYFSRNIITVSKYSKNNFPKIISSNVKVFANIFDERYFYLNIDNAYKFKKKYNIPNNKWIIGYVGRLAKIKNLKLIIHGADILINKNKIDNIIFVFIGSDEDNTKSMLKSLIKQYSLNKYFIFIDHIYKIEEGINILDCLIAPSLNDSFGRTIIEAMLMKKPVLAANLGAHKEIIKNLYNGLLFENKPEDFSDQFLNLYNNSNLRDLLIKNAYSDSKIRINPSKIKKEIIEFYQ